MEENAQNQKSFTKCELAKQTLEAIVITGVGTGAITTSIFDYKIGIVVGVLSAALNIHGVFYRNKHYSEYYG